MLKRICSIVFSLCAMYSACASDLADIIQDGSFWTMSQNELSVNRFNGMKYRRSGENAMQLLAKDSLTIGGLSPNIIELTWDAKTSCPVSMSIMLYNKGDDGSIDKNEFTNQVKKAQVALNELCGVEGKKKSVSTQESGVKLKAWVWEWDGGAAMLEAHETGRGKKDYEAEFIRLRMAQDMSSLERGGAGDAGTRRSLAAYVKRTEDGDVWIDKIPMVDQGEKGYCLPATVARIFSYYGMDGVDMHALASLCDTRAGGGTTIAAMLDGLEKIGTRFHVRINTFKDKSKKPTPEEIVKAYNKLAKRKGVPPFGGFSGVRDRDIDGALAGVQPEILEESFPMKKNHLKKWFRPVYKSIDEGIPVLWGIPGHMRLIIGYNEERGLIYYSDSWGAGHEKKKMSSLNAYMITLYRGSLRLSK